MNEIKGRMLAGILITVVCSCNDLLDIQNDGRTTLDDIFSGRHGVMGYLNACYGYRIHADYRRSSLCDDAWDSEDVFSNSLFSLWYGNAMNASNYGSVDGSPWTSLYEGVRKCNVFLERMSGITAGTILATEGELTGWVAQAHTLRAYYYLQLVKRYGGVPLITEAYTAEHDYSRDRRASFPEVVAQILADCDVALAAPDVEMGFSWNVYSGQRGIMTRAVAYAIRSEAATYAVSPLWNDGSCTWDDATRINAEALSQCIVHGYKLFADVPPPDIAQNPYALYFITLADELRAYDKETIYGGTARVEIWRNAGLPSTPGQTVAGPCPTQELVDSYEMQTTGEPPILGYSDAQHLHPVVNPASGYNPANPYIGRDPRFYASVYYNDAIRKLGFSTGNDRNDHYSLRFNTGAVNDMSIAVNTVNGVSEYHIETTGVDAFVNTAILLNNLNAPPGNIFIKMEYKAPQTVDHAGFYFGNPNITAGQETGQTLTFLQTDDWTVYELDVTDWALQFDWGKAGHALRFDVGTRAGLTIDVRNMEINVRTVDTRADKVESFVDGTDGITVTDRRTTRTGYYLRKYNNWKSNRDNSSDGAVRMFRLAELYLNFAESACRSHGPDIKVNLGSGLDMSARDAVNAVRQRAGMPPFPEGMTVEEFEKKYRNERRVELAFEEHRYFDVRRWKILAETERYMTGMRITDDGNGGFNSERIGFRRGSWQDKYYLYPIPRTEVNKMQDHTGINWQNPGWN